MTKIKEYNLTESYKQFWDWFYENEQKLFDAIKKGERIEEDFFNEVSPQLDKLKEGFYFLAGMYDDQTAELVFTTEGNIKNIYFVETLVAAAPPIDGWLFSALKAASDTDVYLEINNYIFDNNNIYFYSNEDPNLPDEINISIVHEDLNEDNTGIIANGVFIFLDNYLGELNFLELIDALNLVSKEEATQKLVPINKLKAFLNWRQKEFVERYDGVPHYSNQDNYTLFRAKLEDGSPLTATINTDLLNWDSKASHPWILTIDLKFEGNSNQGMPTVEQNILLTKIEEIILSNLKETEGFLNIGQQTADNIRKIYFACDNFRISSKIAYQITQQYTEKLVIDYDIYKDKYWSSFSRFIP